ncbi:MAG: hypothetical protein GPJ51_02150 [Candidatus Heimdallarchaeota archaeon]|nr:hypothetical protein [Candidatus Heimdallarchaeota archaeon]
MLRIVKKNGQKTFFCAMDDDSECLGYMCNYAECRERKMGDSGLYLKPMKTQHRSQPQKPKRDQYSEYDYVAPKDLDDKIRKNYLKITKYDG